MKFPDFEQKAFLSPMARITDVAFRSICKKYGAGLTVTELINALGLIQNPDSVERHCIKAPNEDFYSVQLFGHDPQDMADAALLVKPYCDMIDINLGCPAYKICRVGAGSQIMGTPKHVGKIVEAIKDATKLPVSVKMRTGLNEKRLTVKEVAQVSQDAGACMVMIHGRTRDQMYTGKADWNIIKEVKELLDIPVVGNGDVTSPEICKERLDNYKVDYVSIGRGASGNPLLFSQINDFLKKGSYNQITEEDRLRVFEEYIKLSLKYNTSFLHQKIQAQHFTKGMTGGSKLRLLLNDARTSEALLETISTFMK